MEQLIETHEQHTEPRQSLAAEVSVKGSRPKAVNACVQAVAAAVLHALPFLNENLFWCGWLGIALALYMVTRTGWIASWWATWIWSTLAITLAFHWSPAAMAYTLSSGFAMGLAVATPFLLWDGIRLAAGYWLAARLVRDVRLIWLPSAAIAVLLESAMPSVFPWGLGLPQLAVPWLVQPVDFFGASWTTLIAFAYAGVCIVMLDYILRRKSRSVQAPKLRSAILVGNVISCLGILAFNAAYASWAYATWNQRMKSAEHMRFGLVQVDPSYTWSTDRLRELTIENATNVDLICWPESSGGNYELGLDNLGDRSEVFARSRAPERGLQPWTEPKCELLLGGKCYVGPRDEPNELYVSALLINASEDITGRYHKRFLMPFGEYVPGEESVPGMAELFDMQDHVRPGDGAVPIVSRGGARLGTMLCYEDMVPRAAYEMARADANILISLINGSAFENRLTLAQHRLLSQLRAVECRKNMLRCAATGETCVISPLGEIVDRLPVQQDGMLIADVALLAGQTQYTRTPWLFPAICFVALLFYLPQALAPFARQSNRSRSQ